MRAVKRANPNANPTAELAALLRRCLDEGQAVEIDGLGVFHPDDIEGFRFEPRTRPKVFIAYVREDAELADRLYCALGENGFAPWLDHRKLLPGQNWPRAIEAAIETCDYFIGCFSTRSVGKRGGFQAEIRYALDCARRVPLDEIFLIPVRLDDCRVPVRIRNELQYVDLFPSWAKGMRRLLKLLGGGRQANRVA